MKTYEAVPASAERFLLGEGPIWDGASERLLWIDIDAGAVLVGRLDGDRVIVEDRLEFAGTVGAVAVGADGQLLVAASRELVEVDAEGNRSRALLLIADNEHRRLNDGKTDPSGRFVIGSCPTAEPTGDEWLKRVEHDGSVTTIDTGLGLSNGLAWSCDGSRFYSIDSFRHVVWVRDYDSATGAVGERSTFVRIEDGYPDGMCSDAEDHLWIAVYGRGEVRRYSPEGNLVAVVRVAALQTTSVAFAGSGRDILVITTASRGLTPEELIEYPDSGRIFTARVDVQSAEVSPWVPVSSD
jgi:sugar lactone lactonase YvrE